MLLLRTTRHGESLLLGVCRVFFIFFCYFEHQLVISRWPVAARSGVLTSGERKVVEWSRSSCFHWKMTGGLVLLLHNHVLPPIASPFDGFFNCCRQSLNLTGLVRCSHKFPPPPEFEKFPSHVPLCSLLRYSEAHSLDSTCLSVRGIVAACLEIALEKVCRNTSVFDFA